MDKSRKDRLLTAIELAKLPSNCHGSAGVFADSESPHIRTLPKGTQVFSGYTMTPTKATAVLENVWRPRGFNEGGIGKREGNEFWVTFFGNERTARGYAGMDISATAGVIHRFTTKRDLKLLCVTMTFQDAHEVADCLCKPRPDLDGTCVTYAEINQPASPNMEIALCDPWRLLKYEMTFTNIPAFNGKWLKRKAKSQASRKGAKRLKISPRKVHTGPRGGRFHLIKGRKVYLKRSE
jgi:hypothetical protein